MNDDWILYYNPRCGSCRTALKILNENAIEPRIVEYLKTPPSLAQLKSVAEALGGAWRDMVRTKEPVFQETGLTAQSSQSDLLNAIAAHPILLQRPIVIHGRRGVVARPPDTVKAFISDKAQHR